MKSKKRILALAFLFGNVGGLCAAQASMGVDMRHVYCIILAGGNGERLWPLSRQSKPKQLLSLCYDETLLDQAIKRVSPLVEQNHIWISTTEALAENIEQAVGTRIGKIVMEPGVRNTGPAILLCCLELQQEDPEAVVIFMPADSFIPNSDNGKFVAFLERATRYVSEQARITLLGVRPTYPATGYGYIEFEANASEPSIGPYPVTKFREKPSYEVAQSYIESGRMLWNIGMFVGKVSVFIDEFKRVAPKIHAGVAAYKGGTALYESVHADSIDYAVLEKSDQVSVLPVDFTWCDVGNVEVFLSLKERYGVSASNVVLVESHNNLINVPDKLVALVDVNDLCVVQTDDALLITKRSQAEKVKAVVKQLKHGKNSIYL